MRFLRYTFVALAVVANFLPVVAASGATHVLTVGAAGFYPPTLSVLPGDSISLLDYDPSFSHTFGAGRVVGGFPPAVGGEFPLCDQAGKQVPCSAGFYEGYGYGCAFAICGSVSIHQSAPNGKYTFFCQYHPWMVGVLIIGVPAIEDTSPPQAPTISSPSSETVSAKDRFPRNIREESAQDSGPVQFSGAAEPGSIVSLDNGKSVLDVLVSSSGAWTADVVMTAGRGEVKVWATDSAGNRSPVVSKSVIVQLPPWGWVSNYWTSPRGEIWGRARPGSLLEIHGENRATGQDLGKLGEAIPDQAGDWATNANIPADIGGYDLRVRLLITDSVGTNTETFLMAIDRSVPPPPTILGPPNDSTQSGAMTMYGRGPTSTITKIFEGSELIAQTDLPHNGWWDVVVPLPAGTHTLVARAENHVGTLSEPSAPITVHTSPKVASITKPTDGSTLSTTLVDVSGLSDPYSTVQLMAADVEIARTESNIDGKWWMTVPLDKGPLTLTAIATALNGAITESSISLTVDVTASRPYDAATANKGASPAGGDLGTASAEATADKATGLMSVSLSTTTNSPAGISDSALSSRAFATANVRKNLTGVSAGTRKVRAEIGELLINKSQSLNGATVGPATYSYAAIVHQLVLLVTVYPCATPGACSPNASHSSALGLSANGVAFVEKSFTMPPGGSLAVQVSLSSTAQSVGYKAFARLSSSARLYGINVI